MRSRWAFVYSYTLQTMRDWSVVILSLMVPAAFCALAIFAGLPAVWALSMALVFAIVTNGLFGAAVRVIQERQMGVLRRLGSAPIGASHVVTGAVLSGIIVFSPCFLGVAIIVLAGWSEQRLPNLAAVLALTIAGLLCCRSIGVFLAAVAESVNQCQLLAQVLIIMLMFSSATAWLPDMGTLWIDVARTLSPSYHLTTAFSRVLAGGDSATAVGRATTILSGTGILFMVAASYCFRWDTEEGRMNVGMRVSLLVAFCVVLRITGLLF